MLINEDGFYEIEYEGKTYVKENNYWSVKTIKPKYYTNEKGQKYIKYIIPVGGLSTEQAEQMLKQLISDYNEADNDWFLRFNELNIKLDNILRKEKLKKLKWS